MEFLINELMQEINHFINEDGKITLFPAKKKNKLLVLIYLSSKFDMGINYTEKQVNEIIEQHHTFQDKWLLRRELIDKGFLERLTDGSSYWKKDPQPKLEDFHL
ncbi:MAG: hypothetical protein K0S76_306 [Herbinix sp.]|jgi:hypothetical protein|nr:hypothetical protein [Herbinix sp.]